MPVVMAKALPAVQKETVTVGVFADRGVIEARQRWQETIDWLNQQIPTNHFLLKPLPLERLQEEISQQRLPFIIVNPSESIRIGRTYPLSWLVTLVSPMGGGSTYSTGSSVWVKADSNISTVDALAGRRIGTVDQQAFGGFMAFAREIIQEKELAGYFSQLIELGYPHESVVKALVEGRVEGAILPVCLVESMISKGELEKGQLRALGQRNEDSAQCMVSTRLYPNWSFAMTGAANRDLAKKVVVALLAVPPDSQVARSAQSLGWSVPESEVELDRLFTDLGIHPLQEKWWTQVWQWVMTNYYAALLGMVLLAILPVQHLFLTLRYRHNSLKLRCAQENLQQVQRRALVDKLGSSLAHELNQPLAAIRLYTEGEISRRKQGRVDTDVAMLLSKIHRQATRIDAVVSRFRSLLQKKSIEKTRLEINTLISDAMSLVEVYANQQRVHLQWQETGEAVYVNGDRAAIEQLIVNLLTNAIDATSQNAGEQVTTVLTTVDDKIQITICDQGAGLSLPFEALLTPFVTTKPGGVGLGLAICKDVTESHSGEFELRNFPTGGCRALVRFPITK